MLRSIARSRLFPTVQSYASRRIEASGVWRPFFSETKQSTEQSSEQSSTTSTEPGKQAPTSNFDTRNAGTKSAETASETQMPSYEQMSKQLQDKDTQLAELNDRTLRALAEMENVRMIARRDVENARKYSIVPFAKSILTVADNLGLALSSVDKQHVESNDADPLLKGLYVGVGATESELLKVFSQYGISRFGKVGDKFDPNKYQALFEAPSEEHEPGTVINIQKVGYEMGDRVLRPAEVGVSRAP